MLNCSAGVDRQSQAGQNANIQGPQEIEMQDEIPALPMPIILSP